MDLDHPAAAMSGLLARLATMPAWFADLAINVAVLTAAGAAALAWEYVLVRLARRAVDDRRQFLGTLLPQIRGPIRVALVIFALGLALPAARLDDSVAAAARHALLIAFIALTGWVAIIALGLAARAY